MSGADGEAPLLLLVEDSDDDVLLARMALGRTGIAHTLVTARNGVEALDFLLARGASAGRDAARQPSVVLLDLKLPLMGGHDVLRAMRADPRAADTPVVVVSSSADEGDILRAYEGGAQSYFRKPVDFSEFADEMTILCYYWIALNADHVAAATGAAAERARQAVLRRAQAPRPGERPRESWDPASRPRPVVVIDRDPLQRAATLEAIRPILASRPITEASDGEEARRLLLEEARPFGRDPWTRPLLVLFDLGADPRAEVLREVRATAGHTVAVVAFTGRADPEAAARCRALRVNSVVVKPGTPEASGHAAAVVVDYWTRLNAFPPQDARPR